MDYILTGAQLLIELGFLSRLSFYSLSFIFRYLKCYSPDVPQ